MEKPEIIVPDINSVTQVTILEHPLPIHLSNALIEARKFLSFYKWVGGVKGEYIGAGFDGILYIFLFEIVPARDGVDSWLWVVVGDVPPAYITCEDAKNPYEALDAYVGAMEEWVRFARAGKSVSDIIPVNIPATTENADMLDRRLKLIDKRILPTLKSP